MTINFTDAIIILRISYGSILYNKFFDYCQEKKIKTLIAEDWHILFNQFMLNETEKLKNYKNGVKEQYYANILKQGLFWQCFFGEIQG